MIDFTQMHIVLKVLVYPVTLMGFGGLLMYISKFFCFGPGERLYDKIDRASSDECIFVHITLCFALFCTVILWGSWVIQIEPLMVLSSFISLFSWFMCVGIYCVILFHPEGFLIGGIRNIHKNIHKRKYGG